ncbi:MAG: AAA family ATPase [Enterobacteriaceae bacterium]|nr:AAA family ATPase [Enterobacteriaceae bacterium]
MRAYIKSIKYEKTGSLNEITLNDQNLIIVGNNGAGKTNFLSSLNNYISDIVTTQSHNTTENIIQIINNLEQQRRNDEARGDTTYSYRSQALGHIQHYQNILDFRKPMDIKFENVDELIHLLKERKFIYRIFRADRSYRSENNRLLTSIDELYNDFESNVYPQQTSSSFFERFLVSMSNYALIEKGAGGVTEFERVTSTINRIASDLRELFEDSSLRLEFNRSKLRMEIIQEGKEPYDLEKLPSGYASILAVYAELIMLSELSKTIRSEIKGIVLIDEIDAHLHVTLQKKVFSFFSNSFPNIQFIISTHSPFVVQSVSDALIYNLSTNEKLTDVSNYSYTAIIKGLLRESTNSENLDALLEELRILAEKTDFGERYLELINQLDEDFVNLDSRSKSIVLTAKAKFIEWEEGQPNV